LVNEPATTVFMFQTVPPGEVNGDRVIVAV
jgi:hypothetical protein